MQKLTKYYLLNINLIVLIISYMFNIEIANAQNRDKKDTLTNENFLQKKKAFKRTSVVFGGTGILFTQVNGQNAIMNGGRGAATFNNRFTFGGGGWGMSKGIELEGNKKDTFEYFKFGYGGLEFGYILHPGEKLKFGTHLLVAYGAGFKETIPKSKNDDFKMFPVFEPSMYSQISIGKLFRLDIGVTYRYVAGTNFSNLNNLNLNGLSCYLVLLVGSCNCK